MKQKEKRTIGFVYFIKISQLNLTYKYSNLYILYINLTLPKQT